MELEDGLGNLQLVSKVSVVLGTAEFCVGVKMILVLGTPELCKQVTQ